MHKVFVYGTLKRGFGNNVLLRNSRYIGDFVSPPIFEMFAVGQHGGFPLLTEGEYNILGEIWEVDDETLRRLDGLEGVPHMYRREKFFVDETIGDVFYYHWNRNPPKYKHGVKVNTDYVQWIGN